MRKKLNLLHFFPALPRRENGGVLPLSLPPSSAKKIAMERPISSCRDLIPRGRRWPIELNPSPGRKNFSGTAVDRNLPDVDGYGGEAG